MAKRITSTVNWAAIIEKHESSDRVKLSAFKAVVDKYLREIASRPAELPKIDWNSYKSRISAAGMVDNFQKSYETLKVPYPTDQGLIAETEKFNANFLKKTDEKLEEVKNAIKKLEEEKKELESRMPYAQMTLEEFFLARPDLKIDPDNPKLWPHHLDDSVPPVPGKIRGGPE